MIPLTAEGHPTGPEIILPLNVWYGYENNWISSSRMRNFYFNLSRVMDVIRVNNYFNTFTHVTKQSMLRQSMQVLWEFMRLMISDNNSSCPNNNIYNGAQSLLKSAIINQLQSNRSQILSETLSPKILKIATFTFISFCKCPSTDLERTILSQCWDDPRLRHIIK